MYISEPSADFHLSLRADAALTLRSELSYADKERDTFKKKLVKGEEEKIKARELTTDLEDEEAVLLQMFPDVPDCVLLHHTLQVNCFNDRAKLL